MHTTAALLYPDALATSFTLPMEILQAASQMASVKKQATPQIDFQLAAHECGPLVLASGLAVHVPHHWRDLPPPDLLIVPAIWRNPLPTVSTAADLLTLLRDMASTQTRICSVGTGSYLLAEAGLLDGRPATTHWNYCDHFARRYPRVELKPRHLITQSDNIYCVGSVNSIADLMVHIVEDWFGSRIARAIEHQFSPEIRRSFRAAAYQNEPNSSHHDEAVIDAQQWLQGHMGQPLSLKALAGHLDMSQRTLNRRFRQATGMSPQAYLQSLRVTEAKDLLRHSNLRVGEIAWQIGLADASYFSQLFKCHVGITPLRYREVVRGKIFNPGVPNTTATPTIQRS